MTRRHWSGERARQARREAGLSQQEVANALGVHRSAVSEWENGHAEPLMRYAAGLADLFDLPLDVFVTSHDPEADSASTGRGKPTDGAAAGRRSPVGAHREG